MKASRVDLTAWRRVPFGGAAGDQDIVVLGLDWSAAGFAMQVRAAPGDTGTPLADLVTAAAGVQGLSATYDAGYLYPANGPNVALRGTEVGATIIRPQIDQATLEAIPLAADDPAAALPLWYDLHVTPPTMPKQQFLYGIYTLNPGVTI
jgi:hypothetical protein